MDTFSGALHVVCGASGDLTRVAGFFFGALCRLLRSLPGVNGRSAACFVTMGRWDVEWGMEGISFPATRSIYMGTENGGTEEA